MNIEENSFSSLKPSQVQYYLSSNGWKNIEYKRTNISKYIHNDSKVAILVPNNIDSIDYSKSLQNCLRTVSELECIQMKDLLRSISSPNADIMSFRYIGDSFWGSSLPLDFMQEIVKNISDSIVYSASAELKTPRKFYPRRSLEAIQFMRKAKFAQTDEGSFIINVIVPFGEELSLNKEQPTSVDDTQDPLGRRVVSRINRGIINANYAVKNFGEYDIDSELEKGLNSNLAHCLSKLAGDREDIIVEFSTNWNKQIVIPSDLQKVSSITLDNTTFEKLKTISSSLETDSPIKNLVLVGEIVSLSKQDLDDDIDYVAVLKLSSTNELAIRKIKVSLDYKDYQECCDALKSANEVELQARVEKVGKYWTATKYSGFKVKN